MPGATLDPTTGVLDFSPDVRWLDDRLAHVDVEVTARGREVDSGIDRVSTVTVRYEIVEGTSFQDELVPLFLLPEGASGGLTPELESDEGHGCVQCHGGALGTFADLDLRPDEAYAQLVDHDVAPDGMQGAICEILAASGVKRVIPNDLTKSLWFMKVAGTDGANEPSLPCGTQMPNSLPDQYFTVTDQAAADACAPADGACRIDLLCDEADLDCKLEARLVQKASAWILAGAPNN